MTRFWNSSFWGPPSHKPIAWVGAIIAGTGLLLALEMAPAGPANRPAASSPTPHKLA